MNSSSMSVNGPAQVRVMLLAERGHPPNIAGEFIRTVATFSAPMGAAGILPAPSVIANACDWLRAQAPDSL